MSFFSSLQEYVSNSVAGLSLSPKRFSLSRTDTTIESSLTPSSTALPVSPGGSRSASGDSNTPGFPKVLPLPGLSPLQPNHRRRTLECLVPAPPVRRPGGSFRQRSPKPPVTPTTERPSFCCRRLSWTDIDHQIQSGIQEVDGAYFESFPTLAWKQENKRQSVQRAASVAAVGSVAGDTAGPPVVPHVQGPMAELALGIAAIDYTMSPQEKDKLYIEMLYTIANAVGAPAPGGQYAHYKEDLYLYGQRAFGVPPDRHYRMLHLAGEEKPPIIVLSVIVLDAEGLEAKDANGFSDPYCMLGIQPVAAPSSPQPNTPNRTLSADMCNDNSSYMSHSHSGGGGVGQALSPSSPGGGGVYIGGVGGCSGGNHEKLRKHHSFKLSFKRKEGRSSAREQRDSLTGAALPAKFIRATSVKPHTLNPRWNEKFRFDIDETGSDSLHLDIWDHDDESSVLEAVSKLNEVRGVRGLGRYFKQVCQSARQSSQDDFLGCVTIPLQDIPSTGMEGWFKLEARSQRSSVQGRIRLKMWLSTREDHGISEEDNWTELMQHESLYSVFIDYELKTWRKETWTWPGDLPGPALTILHQHAVQGDLTELQAAIAHFVGAARVYLKQPLEPKWVLQLLTDIEHAWTTCTLTREEEMWLAESFTSMLERWLLQLRHHRQLFPALHTASLTRLEYVLRCLAYLSNMKAFWKCCPFNKEIRGEIVASLRKGTPEWFLHIRSAVVARCQQQQAQQDYDDSFVDFCAELYLHLQQGLSNYHPLFEGTNGIPYFSVVFKQLDKLLADEVVAFLTDDHHQQSSSHMQAPSPDPAYSRLILAVYLEVKDLAQFSQQLPSGGDHKLLLPRCHEWFEPAVSCWLEVCKCKALHRVRKAVELQKPPLLINDQPNLTRVVRHNSSAVDIVVMFCQLRDFWRLLQWPRAHSVALLSQLLDCVCSAALLYADIVYQELVETGYFDYAGPYRFSEEMCVAANNLEYVYKFISLLENYFDFITLESVAVESQYHVLTNQLDSTLSQLQTRVLDILQRVGPQMQESLRKAMFHLAWSPDTLPTAEAVQPLFDYLWTNLQQLNVALLGQNFQRVMYEVWEYTLAELDRQTDGGDTTSAGTNAPDSLPPLFHDRLHAALDLLLEFFHAEGQGLSVDALRSGQYAHVAQRLQYHRMDTENLLEVFLGQRLIEQQQIMMAGSSIQAIYGVLAVRAYFNHDSLCVEVLHARDIIPLDPNGFSDPFVIIELLPHRVFPHCTEQQTNVHKKTLHPVFDECFEFSVSLEQCRAAQAMIGFTVMDHDVLTANDFAGEAFLALGSIPGVTNATGLGVDNFHGLKPVELVLMQQSVKNQQPILQILELRSTDRLATDFVRKQRLRLSN